MSISIVIPLYNKEQYITKTIQSVFKQTYQDFEIIIVNDGSTDNSVAEVEKLKDKKIRIVHQENLGVSAARNRGIEEAKFDLIAFLDADDEWLSNHLKKTIELIHRFSECEVFATNYKIVDVSGKEEIPVDINLISSDEEDVILKNYFDIAIQTAPPLWTSAIVVRKDAIKTIGGFPIGVTSGEDLLTWAKLACKYKIAYSKEITAVYNVMQELDSIVPRRNPQENDKVGDELHVLMKQYQDLHLNKYVAHWHKMRFMTFLRLSNKKDAYVEFKKIIRYVGWNVRNLIFFILLLLPHIIVKKLFIIKNKL